MTRRYNQLGLDERVQIEQGLDRGGSFRKIARLINRDASTISREIRENSHIRSFRPRRAACRDKSWCKRVGVCSTCVREGAFCSGCDARDCRDECAAYALQNACERLNRSPWVCNGCRKRRYGCNRSNRRVYEAEVAQKMADVRRSESRRGINMEAERAEVVLAKIKDGLRRGLSPYEISILYSDELGLHHSTIYRWIEAGYGDLTNLELERKVGFRPRKKGASRRSTSHSPKRSHDAFLELPEDVRLSRTEIDSVIGRKNDGRAVLTLYNLPSHVQLGLLVTAHDCKAVEERLRALGSVMPKRMWERWFSVALTDNGGEFADEDGIGAILGEKPLGEDLKIRLYYCDPRQSQQKGSCEKNHTEIRQILKKGMFAFDELEPADMAVLMSHVNSNPRASLGGLTPLKMLRVLYGDEDTEALMDALGIIEIPRDELMLKPEILDIERGKRGALPLTRMK